MTTNTHAIDIMAYGAWAHDVAYQLASKPAKGYELAGRYPTMMLELYVGGKSAREAAHRILAANELRS